MVYFDGCCEKAPIAGKISSEVKKRSLNKVMLLFGIILIVSFS